MDIPDECKENVSIIVYLYEYETGDLIKKATNSVWSKILFDLKQEMGNKIILIPIAVDTDLTSLNFLISRYDISEYPVVIINEEHIISNIDSTEDLETYLK